ncbi:uncharacterized protein BJX67DRAFT_386189 [Aspergillus lucknowensis]|uniref:Ankyrin repeat protein n=1 Tax=Aspergillus lucknowensis TaxID=176173 RepID=A0ABR4L963_9EURO
MPRLENPLGLNFPNLRDDLLTIMDISTDLLRRIEQDICERTDADAQHRFQSCPYINKRDHQAINDRSLLLVSAQQGRLDTVQTLLQAGADPNARGYSGKTALHVAAASKSESAPAIIASIIQHGGDVNIRDSDQYTPLHRAVQKLALHNIFELIDGSADVNARIPELGSAIQLAFLELRSAPKLAKDTISKLLAAGADPNAKDDQGMAPLHKLSGNDYQIADDLLAAGGDPNAQDRDGKTPLYYAVYNRDYTLAKRLLTAGGDPTAVNHWGVTPELRAAMFGPQEIKQLFKEPRVIKLPRVTTHVPCLQIQPSESNDCRKEVCKEFKGSIRYFGDLEGQYESPKVSVLDMLYGDALSKGSHNATGSLRWLHLPYTNRFWVDQLIEAICSLDGKEHEYCKNMGDNMHQPFSSKKTTRESVEMKRFIEQTFNETGQVRGFRQAGFLTAFHPSDHISDMISLVLPIIDVDYSIEEQTQIKDKAKEHRQATSECLKFAQAMVALKNSYKDPDCGLHCPRTLDESSYDFLEDDDLQRRDRQQVVTGYLLRLQKRRAAVKSPTRAPKSLLRRCTPLMPNSAIGKPESRPEAPQNRRLSRWDALRPVKPSQSNIVEDDNEAHHIQMLMVPQLWLWKVDKNTIITAFPERWDQSHPNCMLDKVRREFPATATVDDAIVSIADSCINYIEDPFYAFEGRGTTSFEAFEYDIARVANEVTKCYEDFEKSIGITDRNILPEVRKETNLLKEINDILDEIGMVMRILNDQDHAMRKLLRWRSQTCPPSAPRRIVNESCYSHQPLARFSRLDENAGKVRGSLITLLDIRQREAVIDDARENSRQSRVLLVFTTITVVFAPLAFIEQLLALPIRGFAKTYPPAWVFEVEELAYTNAVQTRAAATCNDILVPGIVLPNFSLFQKLGTASSGVAKFIRDFLAGRL